MVKYDYTAYGKVTVVQDSENLSRINPYMYKGYYYDMESGMYYCQSRYYVPEWGRWLNADNPAYMQSDQSVGMNLFAYCSNNPVMVALKLISASLFSELDNLKINRLGNFTFNHENFVDVNWQKHGLLIPVWISSMLTSSDFGVSIAPALRTLYQYIRYPGTKDLNKLYGLKYVPGKLNTVCSAIGYGLLVLNIGLSAWYNFSNDNLTIEQQWIGFGVDASYVLALSGIGYGVGALVSLIPVVGPFLAPFVSAGVTWFIDWTNKKWSWLDEIKQWFNEL